MTNLSQEVKLKVAHDSIFNGTRMRAASIPFPCISACAISGPLSRTLIAMTKNQEIFYRDGWDNVREKPSGHPHSLTLNSP
jgi:hypothetical protein